MNDDFFIILNIVLGLAALGLGVGWVSDVQGQDQLKKDIEAVCYKVTKTPTEYKACLQKKDINEVLKLIEVKHD